MKSKLLYVAVSLVLLAMSFTFDSTDSGSTVQWLWSDRLPVPIVLVTTAIACIIAHFCVHKSQADKDLV